VQVQRNAADAADTEADLLAELLMVKLEWTAGAESDSCQYGYFARDLARSALVKRLVAVAWVTNWLASRISSATGF
jgi:hypothetical protein